MARTSSHEAKVFARAFVMRRHSLLGSELQAYFSTFQSHSNESTAHVGLDGDTILVVRKRTFEGLRGAFVSPCFTPWSLPGCRLALVWVLVFWVLVFVWLCGCCFCFRFCFQGDFRKQFSQFLVVDRPCLVLVQHFRKKKTASAHF